MRQPSIKPLETTLQQLINDLESDPKFNPAKLVDVKRAGDALKQMVMAGSSTHDAVHASVFLIARLVMMTVPAEEEVTRRENYTRMMFDYMTEAMTTPVCHECGYPHDEHDDCGPSELDLGETEPQHYEPVSHYHH